MIEIDGSLGEGGGQILRTALSLSALTGKAFRIFSIRKARPRPGLMPQHLTAVRAAAQAAGARVDGASQGSEELVFRPGRTSPGRYEFDIGTAGSTGLLFQTLLPPLLFAGGRSGLLLKGGTHVPWSPPFNYLKEVFLPMLGRLGARVEAGIEAYGFYPRGGGRVSFGIEPSDGLRPADFLERGRLLGVRGVSAAARLPLSVAQRQRQAALEALGALAGAPVEVEALEVSSPGQGTFVFLRADYEGAVCGFSALGARGKRAEEVGREAASALLGHHASGACVDAHLADQLALYLALAGGESRVRTSAVTGHLSSNLRVIEMFLPVSSETDAARGVVAIRG
ncbi:MAG: RNA 3'-terminal phosphate cyclase [Thermodesulfovibrionales bacterium]